MSKQKFITEILQKLKTQYAAFIDDAVQFYSNFDQIHAVYFRAVDKLKDVEHQLRMITEYKDKHGIYPKIKHQDNAEAYIVELGQIKDQSIEQINKLKPLIQKSTAHSQKILSKLASDIVDATIKEKDAGKFLTTIILRAPLADDPSRCSNNEKNRPLYTAALTVQLIAHSAKRNLIDNKYVQLHLPQWDTYDSALNEPNDVAIQHYKNNVLIPAVKACLLQNIGSYSPEANELYDGQRYRQVDEQMRKAQSKVNYDKTLAYFKMGYGQPEPEQFEDDKQFAAELQRFDLISEMLVNYSSATHLLGNLIRVPMIYASFVLSSKPKFEFKLMFKAYDVLSSAIEKKVCHKDITQTLQKLVGRFPLGVGLFFISKETNVPERGVVTTLNPTTPNCAIVKQLTKRQSQFDDNTQVEVTPKFNLLFEVARTNSEFGPAYFKKQFPDGYYWNASALWERDIDHAKFWRRDNKVKQN